MGTGAAVQTGTGRTEQRLSWSLATSKIVYRIVMKLSHDWNLRLNQIRSGSEFSIGKVTRVSLWTDPPAPIAVESGALCHGFGR